MKMVFARKWCCCEIFKGGEVVAKATVVAFVNGAGMEVLLTVVSGENVMFLLDSHKDVGGDRRMVCRCCNVCVMMVASGIGRVSQVQARCWSRCRHDASSGAWSCHGWCARKKNLRWPAM